MARIPKGDTVPLNVTQEARHRVFIGLGWDPNEDITIVDKARELIGMQENHHDLDLACYIYDSNKHYISHVSADPQNAVDQTGQIYHSGDNVEGVGEGDDEQISVELKDLNPAIHSIVFKASIKSGQTFDQVTDPEIRIGDGYSGHNFLHLELGKGEAAQKSGFVFASIFKDAQGVWQLKHIGEYLNVGKNEEWPKALKEYL